VTRVLAAIDNSAAAMPVLETAKAIEPLYGSPVQAVHVAEGPTAVAETAAKAAGVPLRIESGSPPETLAKLLRSPEVGALVLGARGTPAGRRPTGGTALRLITSVPKPLVVVPPDVREPERIDRVLVPLDGSPESAAAVSKAIELARAAGIEVIVLHVRAEEALHAFSDQLHHEGPAWVEEFLARFCSVPAHEVEVELRVGVPEEEVSGVARETGADLIVLGWSQELAPGRAAVVRAMLSSSVVPVLLIPLGLSAAPD
jgi:nucleotide-binding universal stress UspA family protein